MKTAVAVVAVVQDRSELRVGAKVLIRSPNSLKLNRVAGDIQGKRIDVPAIQQTDAGRALIRHIHEHGGGKLPLKASVPVHHVRHAHLRVVVRSRPAAVIRPYIRRPSSRSHIQGESRRSVPKIERYVRVPWSRLDDGSIQVFVETFL